MNNDGIIKDLERMLDEMTTYSNNINQKCTKLIELMRENSQILADDVAYEQLSELGFPINSIEDLITLLKLLSNKALKDVADLRLIFINLKSVLETELIISEETSTTIKMYMNTYDYLKKINSQVILCLVRLYTILNFNDESLDGPSLQI